MEVALRIPAHRDWVMLLGTVFGGNGAAVHLTTPRVPPRRGRRLLQRSGPAAPVPRRRPNSEASLRQELSQCGPVPLLLFPLDGRRAYLRDRHLPEEVRAGFA